MCLDTVNKEPQCQFGIGYKVLEKHGRGYYPIYNELVGNGSFPIGKWIEDKHVGKIRIKQSGGVKYYDTGFHIVLTKSRAKERCHRAACFPFQCLFRQVVATGTQHDWGKVAVAREIMLLEEVA